MIGVAGFRASDKRRSGDRHDLDSSWTFIPIKADFFVILSTRLYIHPKRFGRQNIVLGI
jgi:hypothetical protein